MPFDVEPPDRDDRPAQHAAAGWRSQPLATDLPAPPSLPGAWLLRPIAVALTAALRRAARLRPRAFDRLGDFREAVYVIAPSDAPVMFVIEPSGLDGRVTVALGRTAPDCDARISGPTLLLLGLFDGSLDADAAFFRRELKVEGDTEAVLALHNALEAADLGLADLPPAPEFVRKPLAKFIKTGGRVARAVLESVRSQ